MKMATVEYINKILSVQKEYCEANPRNKEQKAYYDGLKAMYDIVISDAFTKEATA